MKQVVIFTVDDLETMRAKVHDALIYVRKKKRMLHDDCEIKHKLEDIQKILNREDDWNEE